MSRWGRVRPCAFAAAGLVLFCLLLSGRTAIAYEEVMIGITTMLAATQGLQNPDVLKAQPMYYC